MYKLNCSFFFVKIVVRRFASHIFDTFNKKWRQVKPKRRQENGQTWIFFKTTFFGHVLKKNHHIHFLVHGHSSWSTFGLQLVRGPRLSNLSFLRSRTMKVGPWYRTIEKNPLPWSDFMVYNINQPWEEKRRVGEVLTTIIHGENANHYKKNTDIFSNRIT